MTSIPPAPKDVEQERSPGFEEQFAQALQQKRYAQALELIEPRTWSSANADLWNNLGAAYLCAGWSELAAAAYRRGLSFAPSHTHCVNNLVSLLLSQKLPYSAKRVLESAAAAGAPAESWKEKLEDLKKKHPAQSVTFIAPSFKVEATLERCLKSLQAQTYPIQEIIVIDDCSPDRSGDIARQCGIRVARHEKNEGLAAGCNTGLAHCKTDFLAKLDTDVVLEPTWLERAMQHFHDPKTAGVGGMLIEHYTTSLADRFRQAHMEQHWENKSIVNPRFLYGAHYVWRASAVKEVGGWNAVHRTNYEDVDLCNRVREKGYNLIYEPQSLAHHLRRDRVNSILQTAYNYWHTPDLLNAPAFKRISTTAQLLELNQNSSLRTLKKNLDNEWTELTYFSFVLYYLWCLRDLKQVFRKGETPAEAWHQTALGVFVLARHQLRNSFRLPPQVVARTLADLREDLREVLTDHDRDLLESESGLDQLLPSSLQSTDELTSAVLKRLPHANASYLKAFCQRTYLSNIGSGLGAILNASVQAIAAAEEEQGEAVRGRPGLVLYNPPTRKESGGADLPGEGASRWFSTGPLTALAESLRASGHRVLLLDAVALRLGELEAEERLQGTAPVAVVYSGAEGGLSRICNSARRMKLLSPKPPRCILVAAGKVISPSEYQRYPMFDAIHSGFPAADQLLPAVHGISERGYWVDADADGHYFDEQLAAGLSQLFSGKTVGDFGCGIGKYLQHLRAQGITCTGYDGNPRTAELTSGACHVLDLSKPVDLGCLFDWVLSLEVAEHIPPQFERAFIENLHRHNREGIVLSWAVRGQGGRGHVNEQDNAYVKQLLAQLGYINDQEAEETLRRASQLRWFKNTLMVFKKPLT